MIKNNKTIVKKISAGDRVKFPMERKPAEAGEKIGGYLSDEGSWSDLGERESYLDALSLVSDGFRFPSSGRVSPEASIAENVMIDSVSSVGQGAVIEEGASLIESAIWSGARVERGAMLKRVVVRGDQTARGRLENIDL